ncbi:hypothetical protein [Dokdonella sp.]|uniref:hypothetical protein n=1 Tax=Dokdonella sp. TaxID=2291710 RepID=UPI002F3F4F11
MTSRGQRTPAQARAGEIVPFWYRLREISLYPTHSAALTTVVTLALCHLVEFLPLGIVGWLFQLLIWVALYKYAFECLRATANGRLEPPEVAVSVEDSLGWSQIWLQVAFFVLNLLGFILLGPIGGTFVAIFLALALPGAIMTLAMDGSLGHALNPATWIAIMARLQWPYVAVAALYFVFNLSQRYAQALVLPILPPVVSTIAFYFITNYAVVATFHLMGYLIYQYHDEIGYEPAVTTMPALARARDPDQEMLDEAAVHIREGRPESAADLLAGQLRARGGSEAVHVQYRKVLGVLGRRDELLRHGREWIAVLLAQDKDRRAVDVVRDCQEIDPAFEPADPDDVARIARTAVDAGQSQVALRLVSNWYRSHPKHRDVPANCLLAARLLAERMGKEDTARALLDRVLQGFPQHALAGEIGAYRRFLDTLGAPPARA